MCRHGDGCWLYEYCCIVRLHRGSRWLFGILDITQDVLDTSHAVGALVSMHRGVFSASGLPAVGGLPLLVGGGATNLHSIFVHVRIDELLNLILRRYEECE